MPKAKRMRAKPTMSQKVKQNQTVKINIKNLLPERGDYIEPRKGVPRDNLNMGNMSRLIAPSIHYAVRPPEFLPLPERINSQGQPQYFTQGVPRQGRPDLITTETNPYDIEQSKPSIRALPSKPVPQALEPRVASIYSEFEKRARAAVNAPRIESPMSPPLKTAQTYTPYDSPQMDEAQALVQHQAGPSARSMAQQTRRAMERMGSAATTGVPPVPATGFQVPRTPAAMAAVAALTPPKLEPYEPYP